MSTVEEEKSHDFLQQIRQMDSQIRYYTLCTYPDNILTAASKRVQRGIAYNMKIVLRGAEGTSKTSLWQLFQGLDIPKEVLQHLIL